MFDNSSLFSLCEAILKDYLQKHQKCVGIKVIARLGWAKHLKALGMRHTHVVYEKDF